ncbi:hypothetical protein RSOLAG1IB_10181 [Rhizoctonia solani AG-1 IB]|uniref:MYND-type domain-containing protein n=1 Tax=Thanatephorus cucumeris (strain AG1-IB / isolate 7/3/14) TaxID=1108050 RepID=A0A0B7G0S7_THACB|nr:hypothetical protein RSOLAG1IB_10181 [Rhizoctonia solani AG-1 IB]
MPPSSRPRFRVCAARGCSKSTAGGAHLKACAQCKTSHYCSKACQAEDWSSHRRNCHVNSAVDRVYQHVGAHTGDNRSSDLSINLRRWEAFHTPTFVSACILGMNLSQVPQNLTQYALVIDVLPCDPTEHRAKFDVVAVGLKSFREVSNFMHQSGNGGIIDRHLQENQVTQGLGGLGQALALLRCQIPGLPCLVQVKPVLITSEAIDAHATTTSSFQGYQDWAQVFQRAIKEDWAQIYHMTSIAANCFADVKH